MVKFLCCILALALLVTSCGIRRAGPETRPEEEAPSGPILDPLASSTDREVVPAVYPVRPDAVVDPGDSLARPRDVSYLEYDSLAAIISPTEVYRVQIFTSRLYAEAVRERALADEIFNLPVYLDYEVPYYKLRVGDFVTRDEAENMVPEIKAIGYGNAWVARVVLRVRGAPEVGDPGEPILPADSVTAPSDSTVPGGRGDGY